MNRFCVLIVNYMLCASSLCAQDLLDFGPVRIGSTQVDTVRISNFNLVDMMVEQVLVSDPVFTLDAAPFSGDLIYVAPGETQNIAIRFAPAAVQMNDALLSVISNHGQIDVFLRGEGATEVVVINEILADPPNGIEGDANGDGVRHTFEDEFVELLNIGRYPIDLSGLHLSDAGAAPHNRFAFPQGAYIAPGEYIVLFGGGNPTGFSGQVFVDNGRIGGGLGNSGDAVFLIDQAGPDTLARAEFGAEGGRDLSLVRHPEGRGPWVLHNTFPGRGDAFSPGRARVVLSNLQVIPAEVSIAIGDTLSLNATGAYSDGDPAAVEGQVIWVASDSSRVLPVGHGQWVGIAPGVVEIRAQVGDVLSGAVRVEIRPPDVVGIEVALSDTWVLVGDTLSASVQGVLSDGVRVMLQEDVTYQVGPMVQVAEHRMIGIAPGQVEGVVGYGGFEAAFSLRVLAYGDLNADGVVDLVDAVRVVHIILGRSPMPTPHELRSADLDGNGEIDIRDLVRLIRLILGLPAEKPLASVPEGTYWIEENALALRSGFPIQALYLEWAGGGVALAEPSEVLLTVEDQGNGIWRGVVVDPHGEGFQSLRLSMDERGMEVKTIQGATRNGSAIALRHRDERGVRRLNPGFPNPFNPSTVLKFYLPVPQNIMLVIYTSLGQEVVRLVQGTMPAGRHTATWDGLDRNGRPVSSGVYLGVLKGVDFQATTKLVLLR